MKWLYYYQSQFPQKVPIGFSSSISITYTSLIFRINSNIQLQVMLQVHSLPIESKGVSQWSSYTSKIKPDQIYYSYKPSITSSPEASLKSPLASDFKPNQVYVSNQAYATTSPETKYLPRQVPVTIAPNRNNQNNANSELEKNGDEDLNKIRQDVKREMANTRSLLKLNVENAGTRTDQIMGRIRDSLQLKFQLESDDMLKDAATRISSLRKQREFSDNNIRSRIRQLHQETFGKIRQMRSDFAKANQLKRQTLVEFNKSFPADLDSLVNNKRQLRSKSSEKLRSQFNLMVDDLGTKIEETNSHLLDLSEQTKLSIRRQLQEIRDEMISKARAIYTDMLKMFADRKQILKDVYKKVQPMDKEAAKEYVNQEKERVTAEMSTIKGEMVQKMMNEIKKVINMVKTEVESIESIAS